MARFSLRGFTSLLLSFAFPVVLATGLVLWLTHSPQTLGVVRGTWRHAHIFVSLLVAFAAVLHLVLNWSVYWGYLRSRLPDQPSRRWELAMAAAITAGVVIVASLHNHEDVLRRLGEMNLRQIAQRSGLSVSDVVAALKQEGIDVRDAADSLAEIAQHNKVSPRIVAVIVHRQMPLGPPRPSHVR